MIWDISFKSFLINFESTSRVSEGDFEIDKNIKGDISQISQTVMKFLINHIFTDKSHPRRQIKGMITNQRDDTKQWVIIK